MEHFWCIFIRLSTNQRNGIMKTRPLRGRMVLILIELSLVLSLVQSGPTNGYHSGICVQTGLKYAFGLILRSKVDCPFHALLQSSISRKKRDKQN